MRWRCNFKELSPDGDGADFSKNERPSLFNECLSNEPRFSRIHLAGQHLKDEVTVILLLVVSSCTCKASAHQKNFIIEN
jgi:hypothetical protein